MNVATLLKNAANVLAGVSLVRLLGADLKAEIRQDGARLRDTANGLVHTSPYRAVGLAAATAALAGLMLARRRSHRTIPTRH
jgi:ElaB/YqjD/DUF883 family membrane-anchored ribosome-binding protein